MFSENRILNELSEKEALETVKQLTTLGERICGSKKDKEAAELIASKLSQCGLDISVEPFKIISWDCSKSEIKMLRPEKKDIICTAFGYSPSTPPEGLKAEVVYVGDGLDPDYKGRDVKGKIVLARWSYVWFAHQYWIAVKNRAAAFLLAYESPGFLRKEAFGINGKPLPIPCALITNEDYKSISKLLMNGYPVLLELRIEAELKPNVTSHNVVGKLKGDRWPEQEVVLCGHMDNWFYGANDNASSIATLIEIARVLSKCKPKRTVTFLATSAEETGSLNWFYYLQGSNAYVKRHAEELKHIVAVFNGEFLGCGEKFYVETTPELLKFLKQNAQDLGIINKLKEKVTFRCPPSDWTDAFTFAISGVPSSCTFWIPYEQYHTPEDTVSLIDLSKLKTSLNFLGLATFRMANVDVLPYALPYYVRILVEGSADFGITEFLIPGRGYRSAKGLIELNDAASGMISLEENIKKAEELLRLVEKYERLITSPESHKLDLINETLRNVCQILHSNIIGAGGHYALNEVILYRVRPIDDLVYLRKTLETLKNINGSFIDSSLKNHIDFLGRKMFYVDIYDDIRKLEIKLENLKSYLESEADKLLDVLGSASKEISEAMKKL